MEYIIWGIPPGEKYEVVLYTKCKTLNEAQKTAKYIEAVYGATKTRVQTLDLSTPPKFSQCIN